MTRSFFHTFVCFLQIIFKKSLAKVYQELAACWKKGTVYAIAAANAMVVFYTQNFGEFVWKRKHWKRKLFANIPLPHPWFKPNKRTACSTGSFPQKWQNYWPVGLMAKGIDIGVPGWSNCAQCHQNVATALARCKAEEVDFAARYAIRLNI